MYARVNFPFYISNLMKDYLFFVEGVDYDREEQFMNNMLE